MACIRRPCASTRRCRFLPLIVLPASSPCGSWGPLFQRFSRSGWSPGSATRGMTAAVGDASRSALWRRSTWRASWIRSSVPPQLHRSKIIVHRRAWRQVFRDRPPLATGAQDGHRAVDDLAQSHRSLVAAALGWWNMRLDQRPRLVGQARGIAQAAAIVASAVFLRPRRRRPRKESRRLP